MNGKYLFSTLGDQKFIFDAINTNHIVNWHKFCRISERKTENAESEFNLNFCNIFKIGVDKTVNLRIVYIDSVGVKESRWKILKKWKLSFV